MDHTETSTQPVIAATFTHSILVESASNFCVNIIFWWNWLIFSDIIKEPAITNGKDDEKQLLTKKEDDGKYSSNYLPGLSWVCLFHMGLFITEFFFLVYFDSALQSPLDIEGDLVYSVAILTYSLDDHSFFWTCEKK